jgi:hypothetical protein
MKNPVFFTRFALISPDFILIGPDSALSVRAKSFAQTAERRACERGLWREGTRGHGDSTENGEERFWGNNFFFNLHSP